MSSEEGKNRTGVSHRLYDEAFKRAAVAQWASGVPTRRVCGVLCLNLVPDDEKQTSLFRLVDPEREAKERRLMVVVDKLNLWGGRGTVRAASMGTGDAQRWQMRRERKTPCYTTRIEEVPRARV